MIQVTLLLKMKFKAEEDLIKVLKKKLKETFFRENIEIFEEVSLGYGIADIVISDINNRNIENFSVGESLTKSDINIYIIINKNPNVSFDNILDTTRTPRKAILKSLRKLINRGLVKQKDDSFSIQEQYQLPFKNNFAIEAKLKDWKRALSQAHRYKWFAEYSYVVLDAHYSQPAIQNIGLFRKFNIGLATITPDGEFTRIFNPIRQKPLDATMQILFSEKIINDYSIFK